MSGVRAGDVIAGKFQVERVLGEGGMGYVVAARHLQLGQVVALKFIRDEVCTSDYKSRFFREARNTVRLKSKHVSRVLDVGALEGGAPYMVMEYLEGIDLSEMLQQRGPFPVGEACEYIIQACEAIAEAHGHGIVHRDLKPANLFLTRGSGGEPVVKVLDFGVSKVLDDDDAMGRADSVVTKVSELLGSPTYMAPEQVLSSRDADARSDVWSLGVILFRLIGGKPPFSGASLGDLVQNIMYGPLPNIRDLRPDLPAGLDQVIGRCLSREKEHRPDVVELARSLAPFATSNAAPSLERIAILGPALATAHPNGASGRAVPSFTGPPPPPARSVGRDAKPAPLIGTVIGVAILGTLAILGARYFASKRGDEHPAPAVSFVPVPPPSTSLSSEPPPKVEVPPAKTEEPKVEPPPAATPRPAASPPPPAPTPAPHRAPTVRPVPHPAPHPRPRPAPTPPKPAHPPDGIPQTRE